MKVIKVVTKKVGSTVGLRIGLAGAVLLGIVASGSGYAQRKPQVVAPPASRPFRHSPADMGRAGWRVTFADEFNHLRLDPHKWIDSYPGGVRTHSNHEQQYYGTESRDSTGTALRLMATRQEQGGMPYTSGMIASYGHFAQRYGWFEICAKFPKGRGYWPAFWLLPADKTWPPEVDVLEILGHEPGKLYMSNHARSQSPKGYDTQSDSYTVASGPDFSQGFHTFALEWTPALMVWYVDGVERFRVTKGIPDVPMYVIANLAVGGDWPGNPDATTPFPGYMDIEYIRVYQKPEYAKLPVPSDKPVATKEKAQ